MLVERWKAPPWIIQTDLSGNISQVSLRRKVLGALEEQELSLVEASWLNNSEC